MELDPLDATTVAVANDNWSAVIAHALVDGRSYRSGQVETASRSTFTLPREVALAGEVEVTVEPVAADGDYATGPIAVRPGARVELGVGKDLALSSFRVWDMAP
jgi:hypothetical protein